MSDVGFNNKKDGYLPLNDINPQFAILDTGVSYSIIPSKDFETIENELTSSYNVTFKAPSDSTNVSTHTCDCPNYD